MSDSIDLAQRIPPAGRRSERVEGVVAVHPRKQDDDAPPEDHVDIAPGRHLQSVSDHLDLSLAMIRALVQEELPPEAIEALESFAPLGDLQDALEHCTRVEQKGQDFIEWPNTLTLGQALERSAS